MLLLPDPCKSTGLEEDSVGCVRVSVLVALSWQDRDMIHLNASMRTCALYKESFGSKRHISNLFIASENLKHALNISGR